MFFFVFLDILSERNLVHMSNFNPQYLKTQTVHYNGNGMIFFLSPLTPVTVNNYK